MFKVIAPLGNMNYLQRVFEAGADGIYAGFSGLSRGRVDHGLKEEEIKELSIRCHSKGKILHIAINAIPEYKELDRFMEKIGCLVEMNVDGIILNESGLIWLVRKSIPFSKIFVSVGCGILNLEDALFFQDIGADGITLSWMVDPDEIYKIKKRTSLTVEVFFYALREFIQRGKCSLGPYLNRKSGGLKRIGDCINVCTAKYELIDSTGNAGACLFPFEEFMISDGFKRYIDAGVDLFKIQGREFSIEKTIKTISFIRDMVGSGGIDENGDKHFNT